MRSVNNISLIFLMLLSLSSWGQSTSDKLKKEQARLERKIADTKLLLSKSQNAAEASLNELKVIENQISYREQLLKNYDNQIRGAELTVQKKEQQIGDLFEKIEKLKLQYKQLLLYSYKHRNKYGKLMYLFSSDSYYEAIKRAKYLERISEIQQKQFIVIRQNQDIIREEIVEIKKEKEYKQLMIGEKTKEKEAIEADRAKQKEVYDRFKQEEEQLLARLREEQKQKDVLNAKIEAAIRKEIAEAEERRRKAEAARKKNNPSDNASTTSTESFAETKEAARLSASFEGNKGKLPWPVTKGSITENYGKNPHPTLKGVYTNNRGIDISTPKNAQVRSVFDGEVTSVLNIPGAGKVVIIKHGNYRTVYSNLKDTYVVAGSKVTTKKIIGSLLAKNDQNISVSHFEIHKVAGNTVVNLNPSLWIAR